MKKNRLAPYILVSILIHAGVLIGAHQFLKLPAEELESVELIPVEMVVVSKESPISQPEFAPGGRIMTRKVLQTKSRRMMDTITDRSGEDITTPIPQPDDFKPSVTIAGMATTDYIADEQVGEAAHSKPTVPALQILPAQIPPAAPSAPIKAALLEIKMPEVLVEAEAKLTPADSQTHQRVASPIPGTPTVAEPVFEPPALATKSNDEPYMNVTMVPRRGSIPVVRNGESVAGKPLILASQIFPLEVSLVYPSAPADSSQLEVKIPAVLVEAKAKLILADFQTPQKMTMPLPGIRPATGPVLEPPLPATKSDDEPHMNVDMVPTRGSTPTTQNGESIAVKPLISASQVSLLQVSSADPLPPPMTTPLDVRMPPLPIEAKAATIPAYPQSLQKIETPLTSRRPREILPADHQPIPSEGTYEPVLMVSRLQVQSQPKGAQVYVNGMLVGETPMTWELPLGKHEVRLALPDYYDWKAQIELTETRKTLPIFFRLLPVE